MKITLFFTYVLTFLCLWVFSYLFVDPNLFYLSSIYSGFVFNNRLTSTVIYSIILISLFTCYFGFIFLTSRKKLSINNIKLVLILTITILLFSYPAMLSFDIFNYIATAKVTFFYRENPYVVMPIEFFNDSLLRFMHAPNKIALYGPAWILLSGIPYLAGFGNFIITLFSFKLLISGFYISTTLLLWKITKKLSSVVFFAFNPLVIIETLVSGHNDIVMVFLAIFSFYLIQNKKIWLAGLFLIFSILIKYATIFLLPIFLFCAWKTYKKDKIDWEKIYFISAISMITIFLLSPIREEIYSWYALWFLPFISLTKRKSLIYLSIALSLGLLLRYIPFMYTGTYFGQTPFLKEIFTFVPVIIAFFFLLTKNKLWEKLLFRH